jgi:hypothetical protein
LRVCLRESPHVVERELIGARGIGHLGQTRVVIVRVIYRGGIRIRFPRQPIQLELAMRLALNPHTQHRRMRHATIVPEFVVCATRLPGRLLPNTIFELHRDWQERPPRAALYSAGDFVSR